MEQKPTRQAKLVRNILITIVVGIVTGMLLGAIGGVTGINFSAGVGVVMGITFVFLNSRKDG